jgi:hypothetical protein
MPPERFELLDARGSLRLVTDLVHEDDALCLAPTCRALCDALWAHGGRPAARTQSGLWATLGCARGTRRWW